MRSEKILPPNTFLDCLSILVTNVRRASIAIIVTVIKKKFGPVLMSIGVISKHGS